MTDRRLKRWHWLLTILVFAPILAICLLYWWVKGIGPGTEVYRDRPLPDLAALQRALVPGVSHMEDATKLLSWRSEQGYGVIDANGMFQGQPGATTGPAMRATWKTRRILVRGLGLFGEDRIDYREIEIIFGPPDLTLRRITERHIVGRWQDRTYSTRM